MVLPVVCGSSRPMALRHSGVQAVVPMVVVWTCWGGAREAPTGLILPHPRMQDRAFVLVPLADVAPDWVHPRLGQSVRQMLAALPMADREAVKPLMKPL